MIGWLIAPLRRLAAVLLANDSDRQIAAGAAIGVVLGLALPWTLVALGATLALLAFRVNRAAGFGVASLVAAITPWIDPVTHLLGERVLLAPSLQEHFAAAYDAPLGPWIGFHNTVGCGSLLLGVYLAYPVYLAVRTASERLRPAAVRLLLRYRVARILLGADLYNRAGAHRWGTLG